MRLYLIQTGIRDSYDSWIVILKAPSKEHAEAKLKAIFLEEQLLDDPAKIVDLWIETTDLNELNVPWIDYVGKN